MRLGEFRSQFERGRPKAVEALWLLCRTFAFSHWIPSSKVRVLALRLFGAKVGRRVVVKPGAKVKFPWRLDIGDDVWIGEDVWIDNLDLVSIASDTCISQGAYLCTGSHDWSSQTFDLITKPISIGQGVWIAAKAVIGPGVHVGNHAVVPLGQVVTRDVPEGVVNDPDSATPKRRRHAD